MLRYAISNATDAATDPSARWRALQAALRRWAEEGVDYLQLREKSLTAGELFFLAEGLAGEMQRLGTGTRLLVNSRADIAVAAGAHGVHLTADPGELMPAQVRALFAAAGKRAPVISVSCHTVEEAARAGGSGADLILFGPVFEKVVHGTVAAPGCGLERLRDAVRAAGLAPVLALGGVTAATVPACLAAGAAGVAGIRIFG